MTEENTFLKLKRNWSDGECKAVSLELISKLQIEIGTLKSELAEANHCSNVLRDKIQRQKEQITELQKTKLAAQLNDKTRGYNELMERHLKLLNNGKPEHQ